MRRCTISYSEVSDVEVTGMDESDESDGMEKMEAEKISDGVANCIFDPSEARTKDVTKRTY